MKGSILGVRATTAAWLIAAMTLPSVAGAATIAPTTASDLLVTDDADCTLREAIDSINGGAPVFDECVNTGAAFGTGDTIALAAGTTYSVSIAVNGDDNNDTGDLDIGDPVTITGNAANPPTIQGNVPDDDRVLDIVNPVDVTLQSLIVDDGEITSGTPQGGNILFTPGSPGNTLTLDDVTVQSGRVQSAGGEKGGGIFAGTGVTVEIGNGSLITGNVAGGPAGNSADGGGIALDGTGTDLVVSDSTISDNEAGVGQVGSSFAFGGGISSAATGGSQITLTDSILDGNQAGGDSNSNSAVGGGLGVFTPGDADVEITRGSIEDNFAGGGAGTTAADGAGGGVFLHDTAAGLHVEDATVIGNRAGGRGSTSDTSSGGGIESRADTQIAASVITGNQAGVGAGTTSGTGGGIKVGGTNNPGLTIDDSTIAGNDAGAGGNSQGGGIHMTGSGTLQVGDTTISGNNATLNGGGGIYRASAISPPDTINAATISGNTAGDGGGIFLAHVPNGINDVQITNSTIDTNTANGAGSDRGGGGIQTTGDVDVTNSTIFNNDALGLDAQGGGIGTRDLGAGPPNLELNHVTLAQNASATQEGGNLFAVGDGAPAEVQIRASIVAQGAAGTAGTENCGTSGAGVFASNGFNVESTTPTQCAFALGSDLATAGAIGLAAGLADNGGETDTLALLLGSPAIDRVTSGCPPPVADQRDVARPQGAFCDSGAYEMIPPPAVTGTSPASGSNDNQPEVTGTAVTGSTVTLYANSTCSGTPLATGPQASFASPGITISVADNSTTTVHATATVPGGTSPCSPTSAGYQEVTPPAATPPPSAKKCKKGQKLKKGKCVKKRKKRKR